MKHIVLASSIALLITFVGCATGAGNMLDIYTRKQIDVIQVQQAVVKGKTTMIEIEAMYGKAYTTGILKDGTPFLYYLQAGILGGSQDFTFYFDKNSRVKTYATEYPGGGNPLSQ